MSFLRWKRGCSVKERTDLSSFSLPAPSQPNYKLIGQHCNLWRNYMDIADTWQSVENVIDYYAANQNALTAAAAPGRWNDPDMVWA
ncbi:hypothetical protein HPB48_005039 [Haemaphysalis longicornis]|uniref:Alpha-galactosidase n=1 Tax=Haemaphysalis longicornis TaxID=44386 RepID=A0A9J6G4H4_HAELO|nr:hypothetical protein HPB48_005039 [Haemaphysalis longicornis]